MRTLALAAAFLLCTGCAAGLLDTKQPAQQTYVISAAPQPNAARAVDLPVHLAVGRPIVGPGLYTERIAVIHGDRRLDYFSASRWSGTVDVLLQSLLIESLRNTGRLAGVQNDLSAFTANYLLQTDVRDFQAEYAQGVEAPLVRVNLVCTLGLIRARQPLDEYVAGATAQAADNTMAAVIAAFETAYREAARIAVQRTLQALKVAEQAADTPTSVPPAPAGGSP